jgi:hypothetical protein
MRRLAATVAVPRVGVSQEHTNVMLKMSGGAYALTMDEAISLAESLSDAVKELAELVAHSAGLPGVA